MIVWVSLCSSKGGLGSTLSRRYFICSDPGIGRYGEHPGDQIGSHWTEHHLHFGVACRVYLPVKLLVGGPLEGEDACE